MHLLPVIGASMRILSILTWLLFVPMLALAAGTDRPTGKNCNLASPPAAAGEDFNHGITLRIYPRAKDIDAHYSGCQVLLMPEGEKWVTVSLTEVIGGDPVRVWSAYEKDPAVLACRFKRGKVIQGDPGKCPVPEFILLKSVPRACVDKMKNAANQGTQWPPKGCEYE